MSEASLRTGQPAPDFELPAINREGRISLGNYRGRSSVLIGLYRGLHCPFCRRQIFMLGRSHQALLDTGVETLAIVNTTPDRGRIYFRHNPVPVTLAADADTEVHAAYALPKPTVTTGPSAWPESVTLEQLGTARINPTGELPAALPPLAALEALNTKDKFETTTADEAIIARHAMQLTGHFLVDRDGLIRWSHIEATRGASEIAAFPTPAELLAAARGLPR